MNVPDEYVRKILKALFSNAKEIQSARIDIAIEEPGDLYLNSELVMTKEEMAAVWED